MRKSYLVPALWIILAATPALALSDKPYLGPAQADLIHLLAPPPAADSDEQKRDIEAVLNLQKTRSEAQTKRALADAEVSIFRFDDVLGANFKRESAPNAVAFLRKVDGERARVTNIAKDCWERQRPFVVDGDIHPPGTMLRDNTTRAGATNAAPHDAASPCRPLEPVPMYTYSYPSGHSTFGTVTAILLAEMVPEKRDALYARGREYGRNRIVIGVHYPSDVEAGRITATAMVALMMQNPDFQTDLAAAKAELRQVLGLSN